MPPIMPVPPPIVGLPPPICIMPMLGDAWRGCCCWPYSDKMSDAPDRCCCCGAGCCAGAETKSPNGFAAAPAAEPPVDADANGFAGDACCADMPPNGFAGAAGCWGRT